MILIRIAWVAASAFLGGFLGHRLKAAYVRLFRCKSCFAVRYYTNERE